MQYAASFVHFAKVVSLWLWVCLLPGLGQAEPVKAQAATAPQAQADLDWFRQARFGMFVHWGPSSLSGQEISWSRLGPKPGIGGGEFGTVPKDEYDRLYLKFNPTAFNAKEWVKLAKDAGMKYIVMTTKHHDGFCMFDSQLTTYSIAHTPFRRDLVKELAEACHAAGLRFGVYYSQPDWHHPDYLTERHEHYIRYFHGQVRELLSRYGQVDVIWFDGLAGNNTTYDSENLFKMIRQLQPHILINNRGGLAGDFDTPEQQVGAFQNTRPWESCITLGDQWSYKPGDRVKTLDACVRLLASCACGDGNMLYNVGPRPDGAIEPQQAERFRQVGAWLQKNGESIYGTRGGPFLMRFSGGSTRKGNAIYLHLFSVQGETFLVPPLAGRKILRASVLGKGGVKFTSSAKGTRLTIPRSLQDPADTIVKLELDGPAEDLPVIDLWPYENAAEGKPATAYKTYAADFGPDKAVDKPSTTWWAMDPKDSQGWMVVDLGQPTTLEGAFMQEAFPGRVKAFTIDVEQAGGTWKTVFKGQDVRTDSLMPFTPIKARRIRLNILDSVEGPTIMEFRLFARKANTTPSANP